jgi:hypothetical protein
MVSHKLRPGTDLERILRLTEPIATIHLIHLIGWFVSISLQVGTLPTCMNANGTELINRLCSLRRLSPHYRGGIWQSRRIQGLRKLADWEIFAGGRARYLYHQRPGC